MYITTLLCPPQLDTHRGWGGGSGGCSASCTPQGRQGQFLSTALPSLMSASGDMLLSWAPPSLPGESPELSRYVLLQPFPITLSSQGLCALGELVVSQR